MYWRVITAVSPLICRTWSTKRHFIRLQMQAVRRRNPIYPMSLLSCRFTYRRVLFILLLTPGLAEGALVEIPAVPRETIEQRLRRFSKSNWARERELRKIFEEAGCGADQVSEQS